MAELSTAAQSAYQVQIDADQRAHYDQHGFLLLRDVVPSSILASARGIMEPWVDFKIEEWVSEGLLQDRCEDHGFWDRFLVAWERAGRPLFHRNPNRHLISEPMYDFIRSRLFLDLAEQILGTTELSAHGIFNARPQLPGGQDTRTPFHQDSQYWHLNYGAEEPDKERKTHVLTMWLPLQPVDETSGTMVLISLDDTEGQRFEVHDYNYERTNFLGLSPEDIARYPHHVMRMGPGDLLMFNQLVPHGAAENLTRHIRWSMDVRFEATATATVVGRRYGFVAQSRQNPASETSLEEWLTKRQATVSRKPIPVPA